MLKKKIISIFIIVIMVLTFGVVKKTHAAGLPVIDLGNITAAIFNSGQNVWQVTAENVLEPIAISVADQMLSKLSTDIINWANNGFDGEPGFITNYEELLKGVEFDTINLSFNTANSIALSQLNTANTGALLQLTLCQSNAFSNYDQIIDFGSSLPTATYALESALVQCQIDVSTDQSITAYSQCVATNNQGAIDYAAGIMNGPSAQFLEEFPEYLDLDPDDQLLWIENADIYYQFMYGINQCAGNLVTDTTAGDPAATAAQNWETLESGNVSSSRAVAETVANFGVNQFNNTKFEQVASGGADLTLALLGSQSRKDDFKNDITAGGWEGYLSLLGEGSTELGLTGTVRNIVSKDVSTNVALKEAAVSLPTQILSKTKCELTDNETGECLREVVSTPGDIVATQLGLSLQRDQNATLEFGDSLVSSLVSSLGNVVSGLVDSGLGGLSAAAGDAFFSTADTQIISQASTGGGDFQSQFNVLGIEPSIDPGILNGSTTINGNVGGGLQIPTGIGGPEDNNVQIIIDFKSNLEQTINFALEEKSYYDQIRDVILDATDIIYEFEKCIPGPDYDWEERYSDGVGSLAGNGWDEDERQARKALALNEMRTMVQDPAVTIPGGVSMREQVDIIFNNARENQTQIEFRRNELTRNMNTLSYIQNEIKNDFNTQKADKNLNLVLFREDWNNLSVGNQESAFQYAVENGYALLQNGETISSVVNTDNESARDSVLAISWDIWRNETNPSDKLELRQSYFTLQNNLSNSQFISIAQTTLNEISANITNSYTTALDCIIFKSYALGADRSELINIVNNNLPLVEKIQFMADNYIDIYEPPIPFAGINSFNVSSARSDNELKNFLENEASLQSAGNNLALLQSSIMTSLFSISSSILGFEDEIAKQEYFELYYDVDDLTFPGTGNFLTIKDIYANDRYMIRGERGGRPGPRTTVFCRVPGKFDFFASNSSDDDRSLCFQNWSAISKLDIELIVSDITN